MKTINLSAEQVARYPKCNTPQDECVEDYAVNFDGVVTDACDTCWKCGCEFTVHYLDDNLYEVSCD
jgi:hypothetical protein